MEQLLPDLLENNKGSSIPRSDLESKFIALFIAPHWLPSPLHHALSLVLSHYHDLRLLHVSFVFVSLDRDPKIIESLHHYGRSSDLDDRPDQDCFLSTISKLPDDFLIVPFSDVNSRSSLASRFKSGLFSLCFLGPDGRLLSDQGLALLEKWGAEAFPFDDERIHALQLEYKAKKANQDLQGLLVHENRDFLIRSDDATTQVKALDNLQGKIVALYFSAHWCPPCQRFTPFLASVYSELKQKNQEFEVVFVSSDEDEESFNNYFKEMPWLAVPYTDLKTRKLLENWFEIEGIPSLIILDGQGKTIAMEGTELVYKYGVNAYPFTEERVEQLRREEEAKRAAQTLESLLVIKERDYVLSKTEPVKVSSLVGKIVGLYFSGHWCPPCRHFTSTLKTVYDELKGRGEEFEVIFISSDRDQESFDEYYGSMPWLALPFGDEQRNTLSKYFDIEGIPTLIIIGREGKTLTADGRGLINTHHADAFPFTEDHIAKLQKQKDGKFADLPKEINSSRHAHKLTLAKDVYGTGQCSCDHCGEQGSSWVYHCDECGFDLHPDCIGEIVTEDVDQDLHSAATHEGYVCEGDVCQKV